MPRVEHHHPAVGYNQECRAVVVVGLEAGAHEHFGGAVAVEIVLRGLDVAVGIDVAYVGHVGATIGCVVMHSPRVGEPAPRALADLSGGKHPRCCKNSYDNQQK